MVLDESDTDWNDSEEEMSDSEDLANSLIVAQEDMVDPLQVAQDISNDDDNNEPEMITTSITSQVPSTSNTSGPTSLPTPSSASVLSLPIASVCQQPSTSSNVPELSNRRVPIPFAQHVGPTELLDSDSTPLDFFLQIFGKDTFDHIAEQTNLYAFQNPPSARYNWTDTNPQEIMLLVGIILATGIHRLPSWEDYWSQNPLLGAPGIIMGMPLTRFKVLMKCLHLNDNSTMIPRGQPGYDKLHKIRPLLDIINANSKAMYDLHREVSIDEAMVLFKGRSHFKQFMPKKPIKRGFRVWMECDGHNGLTSQCQIYAGKDASGVVETQLGAKVVKSLTADLKGKGHHLYFDNYFSSVTLAEDLLDDDLYCIATTRSNRNKWPAQLKNISALNKSMVRGEAKEVLSESGRVNCLVWKDNRCVSIIDTVTTSQSTTTTVTRRNKDGTRASVSCPEAVKLYNTFMGGVDLADQRRKTYSCSRKSRKWWHRLFFFFLDLSVVNGYIIATETPNIRNRSQKEFILELSEELLSQYCSRKRPGRPIQTVAPPSIRFNERHFPARIEEKRACVICNLDHIRRRVIFGCADCNKQNPIPLCPVPCFRIYHTKQ